jgi:PAS domain S-box-containing protein
MFRNQPITRKLMAVILVTSGAVLTITCVAFLVYEFVTFRQSMVRNVSTLGQAIAANSTAALAFENAEDARRVLSAVAADPHVVAAGVYDGTGALFASYANPAATDPVFPVRPDRDGYRFGWANLALYQPVTIDKRRLGTLYLQSDLGAMYERFTRYAAIVLGVITLAGLVAFRLATRLRRHLTEPLLALARTAKAVSEQQDYSTRAERFDDDELGQLTDSFNAMLTRVQERDHALRAQSDTLRANEERTRLIVESALDAVVTIDASGLITGWSPQAEKTFGWTRQDALGRILADTIIPEQYRELHRVGLERFLATGEGPVLNRRIELSALHRDGREFPIELSITPVRMGDAVSFSAFVRDITERKQAEQRLHAQLERLNLLDRLTRAIGERQDLKSILQVVIRSLEDQLPLDFCCVGLYDRADESVTIARVGVKSETLARQIALSENARIPIDRNGLSRCVRGELLYEPDITESVFPFPKRLSRGGLRSLVVAPLAVESNVFGVLIAARRESASFSSAECEFLRQLSEHVALAAHQAELHTALQQAYDDLRQTQQAVMQQERLKALGQMASGIAHDINNAISPIVLYSESLLETEPHLSSQARDYLSTIQRAVEDVAQTVARMREFYRAREPQLALAPVDVNRLVRDVVHLTRARWSDMPQQRGVVIRLSTELAHLDPTIQGSESEVREALINLVFNAVDAMPEGGTLTIRTRTADERVGPRDVPEPAGVHVEVKDTGIGMDADTRRRCLEPFFTTKGERGTGLGLAMVYGMIQRHSADIEIESTLGQGTTIRLVFAAPPVVAAELTAPRRDVARPSRLRILLVDDDPLLLRSLQDVLERDGHVVTTANGGQAGIDVFRAAHRERKPFDVVVTDLGMPYVDGRHVASSIKATNAATPVVLLTGWGQRLVDDGDVPSHVDRVLNKPPKLSELRDALSAVTAVPPS